MDDIFKPTGNTPFELAEARIALGRAHVKAASALEELIAASNECAKLIAEWKTELRAGKVSDETRDIAAKALREKQLCDEAIEKLSILMLDQFGFEA